MAVSDVTLDIRPGILMGLIGPNGAGKTTLVNLISGALKPNAGQMWFKGQRITGCRPTRSAGSASPARFRSCSRFPK